MKKSLILFFITICLNINAQSQQQYANIGSYKTTNGDVIKNCKIGYRTLGKLNANKSNVVLCPTHFTGTSEQVLSWVNGIMDTTGLYIIAVDALTNGVSSSPSNIDNFPKVTIKDMVNTQHQMLTEKLDIQHLKAVVGISMGGMQSFEWLMAYPDFMDKVVPIIGSPKQSSQDLLIWQTMADIISHANNKKEDLDLALKRAANIQYMNMYTPEFTANTYPADSLDVFRKNFAFVMKPLDVLGGLNAMIPHDIYRSNNTTITDANNIIKAKTLVVVSAQDHLVNPISATNFAKELNTELVTLNSNCGHLAFFCEGEKLKNAVSEFLKDK